MKVIKVLRFAHQWRYWKMSKQNSYENELNAIRVAIYEEVKDMSPSEMTTYMRSQIKPANKHYATIPQNVLNVSESTANK